MVAGRKRVPSPAAGTIAVLNGVLVGLFMVWELIRIPYNGSVTSLGEAFGTKSSWRHRLLKQRGDLDDLTRSTDDESLYSALTQWITEVGASTVCAYVPVGGEPGSLELLDGLRAAGCRVLLPVVTGPSPLDWAVHAGQDSLRSAKFGLLEPTGERLGEQAVEEADVILVPALAVDHRGVRLGRGAGHYDRSLPLASSEAETIAVVRDHEFVPELPGEAHDVRMGAVATPGRGVVRLPV